MWTLQYSFWNGGSKKYTVFICWSKLNKVGVKVHRFSWPSGLNHCFFSSHNADGVSSNPSSVNHILPLYSFFENNFNKFAFRVINLEKCNFKTCFYICDNILELFYGFPITYIFTFFSRKPSLWNVCNICGGRHLYTILKIKTMFFVKNKTKWKLALFQKVFDIKKWVLWL